MPVCLAIDNQYYFNRTAYYTGFGVWNDQNQKSDVLRQVSLPLTPDQECIDYNSKFDYSIDTSIQICTGSINGGKSATDGDSGGPLVVRGLDNRWRLVGIVSWGFGGMKNIGFSTRINGFTNWIYQNLILN